ncbi:putative capsular polysaccharide biosynthesis protein YwqC [Fervidicola ferrireducens]|uniref:Putative capsular polysaccharide biosynthesis protein YwqC n=1 Tax=Fervidicola ferrireducens TaxID=520764 RepID=A0A140LCR8_9FIRM|nr:Wzz/FepE/Etk N-terminal domain-containing protein [Fervidicola ferrireducens]KXG78343.1 putative capsular polysaccharide biosynthesis protein YwqC [Fervidicola ferrireducens]
MEEIIYEEDIINLKDVIAVLRKRSRLIAAVVVVCVAVAVIYTFLIKKPVYESYTTIMVGKPVPRVQDSSTPVTYQELQTNRLLVSTYGEIAKSRSTLEEVIRKLNLNTTYEKLKEQVKVKLVKNTEIIEIRAADHDPGMAATIANAVAESFSRQVIRIMNVENVQVIDEAIPIYEKVQPKPLLNLMLSLVVGLIMGVALAFLKESLDTTIKSPEDVANYLGLPVIGAIPYVEKGEVD